MLEARLDAFSGGGELGRLIREFNWSQTPLGPVQLVVDDNEDAADMLCEALRALGYQTAVANDGRKPCAS